MQILILSDGKKGHENQSLGLAEALLRRREGQIELLNLSQGTGLSPRKADLVIAAGHRTHPFLLQQARRNRCPSVVIMKPTLPSFLFTRCLIPEHDLKPGKKKRANLIATKGALNRIPETLPPKQGKGLLMLGGASKHFRWEGEPVLDAVESVVRAHPELTWTVGDSRRTPPGLLARLEERNLPLTLAPHQTSGGTWLRDEMLASRVAWITPDSTSMLFEALTAGCRVGTLPLPACGTRLSRAHDLLVNQGWVTPFSPHNSSIPLPEPPARLHETARCAELLLPELCPLPPQK
ncbi:mitochondrial fission ELM1 family protein [Roseibacillus ishigakijimensis]|uniref:Mitochondrial fission ELM1 family protein n=1 Tax=Roseibacillus ishigakijimensis TaxID=454146 RepID=A0A934VNA1_9BACT|nr:ELM1/GtrOC1 family putative glycosyltransferase [Roseibacillus ishigakijimensis]MBK1834815.1 mitochondrial fission ELM1 family protein [Roseibacillus ishigakijimensis]